MHDEFIYDVVNPEVAELVGKAAVKSIELAGEKLKMNVPLTGEYKIGKSWAQTH